MNTRTVFYVNRGIPDQSGYCSTVMIKEKGSKMREIIWKCSRKGYDKVMRWSGILWMIIALLISADALAQEHLEGEEMDFDASFSGSDLPSLESESAGILAAPSYDMAAAKAYIDDMPQIRALIDSLQDDDGLTVFGSFLPSGESLEQLRLEIDNLCADNHKVSLIMVDLKSQSGVSFCSGMPMCTQSTVKAIYVASLLAYDPDCLVESGQDMHDAIVYSDNDAYETLRASYGMEPIRRWCVETGVNEGFAELYYPRSFTARDMLKMWTRLYTFFHSGEDTTGFGAYYTDTLASATKEVLQNRYLVQTKAGWECGLDEDEDYDPYAVPPAGFTDGDPTNDECAINDTGIVYTENGPYLFVIYTDYPFGIYRDYMTPNPLYGLVEALCELQKSIK